MDLMATIKMPISKVKLPFYPSCEVKYRLQNGVSTQTSQTGAEYQREAAPRSPLGTINVIFATPSSGADSLLGIMSVASTLELEEKVQKFKRIRHEALPILPHNDALVVTLCIGSYDVKRVLVDKGSEAEIIYLDLYKGLNLKLEDLSKYDSSLVGFNGRTIIP